MKYINMFKKAMLLPILTFLVAGTAHAQLSGSYTIGGTSPDYATLAAAISDLNSSGVSGPVTFMVRDGSYSGSSWRGQIGTITGASSTNRVTFTSQSNDATKVTIEASTSSSANYVFRLDNASYVTIKNLTLKTSSSSYQRMIDFMSSSNSNNDSIVNCVLSGRTTSSSSNARALIYGAGFTGSNNVIMNNTLKDGGTSIYLQGSGSTSGHNNTLIYGNTITNSSGYYGIYIYYSNNLKVLNNTLEKTGSSTYYAMYLYYPNNKMQVNDNTITASSTGTLYGIRTYYANYYSGSTTDLPEMHNNTFNLTNNTGTTYPMYTYRSVGMTYLNNTFNVKQSRGYIRMYGPLYYNDKCRASNNTFNFEMTSTSSGYMYLQYLNYNGGNYPDTFTNNTLNVEKNNGTGTIYNYLMYYGNTRIQNNTYNINSGRSTTYNYLYYPNGVVFTGNTLKVKSNSATTYGMYEQGSSSYAGAIIDGNTIDVNNQNGGSAYGVYAYYSRSTYMNNVIRTKTPSSNYTLRLYYNYNNKFYNNTIHSDATGSTNYIAYIYNTGSSYMTTFKNNILSKSGNKGYGMYMYRSNYVESDYNNIYVGGGTKFYRSSPYYTTNSLTSWRATTGLERNSLTYDPGYTDPANGDLRPNAADPNAWSVNGRGIHIEDDTMDVLGNPRPRVPADGVPDLGAYSFTPTSTPPVCDASPALPVANSDQVFTFGEDTVAVISWTNTVPSNSVDIRQYTGTKANPINAAVERMFFYTALDGNDILYTETPKVYYKDPWIGNISSETNAVIAKSSGGNSWLGFNYNNASTDTVRNILAPVQDFDSLGNYTGVENARIGIRCVPTPGGFDFNNITKNSADATWDAIWNPLGYEVVIKTSKGTPTAGAGTVVTSNNISFSGLQEDTKYWVYVRFICGADDTSSWGVDTFWTLVDCHAPTLTLSQLNTTQVVVSWPAVKTADKYEYVVDQSPNDPAFGTTIKTTSFLAPYLNSGEDYYVHVRSNCTSIYPQSPWATAPFKTWPLGVGSVANSETGIAAYPNPATDVLKVEVGGTIGKDAVLQLTDVTGKVVVLEAVSANSTTLNISTLPSGIYMLKYRDDVRTETIKVTKQ